MLRSRHKYLLDVAPVRWDVPVTGPPAAVITLGDVRGEVEAPIGLDLDDAKRMASGLLAVVAHFDRDAADEIAGAWVPHDGEDVGSKNETKSSTNHRPRSTNKAHGDWKRHRQERFATTPAQDREALVSYLRKHKGKKVTASVLKKATGVQRQISQVLNDVKGINAEGSGRARTYQAR